VCVRYRCVTACARRAVRACYRAIGFPRSRTSKPAPYLTEDDYSDLAGLVRAAIDAEPYRIGPRINRLRLLLAKLEPQRVEPAVTPYPAPRPSGEPSFVYAKLKGGRRRR
jgi:hypothetical protein